MKPGPTILRPRSSTFSLARAAFLALAVLAAATAAGFAPQKSKPVRKADDDGESKPAKHQPPPAELAPGYMRVPYLQSLGADSVLVAWVASAEGEPAVDYGTSLDYGSTAQAVSDGARRVATLRRLKPGTTYYYRVRAGARVLASGQDYAFRTDRGRGEPAFTFFATGDIGEPGDYQRRTVASILRARPEPELGLIAGDVVYDRGSSDDYDRNFMRYWGEVLRRIPLWPTLGNHDWGTPPETNWCREWSLPGNEHYYSFDHANAHFVAVDTRRGEIYDAANQLQWLENDLRAHQDAAWLFVFCHYPGRTCTYKEDTPEVVAKLLPLFDRYHVDVVFNGHAHTYERLYPLAQGQPVDRDQDPNYTDPKGTIYIVSGAGGKLKKGEPTSSCGPTAFSKDETVVWTRVRVDGPLCTIETFASVDDGLVDKVTITKSRLAGNPPAGSAGGRSQ